MCKSIFSSIKRYIFRSLWCESEHDENDLPIYCHTHLIAILAAGIWVRDIEYGIFSPLVSTSTGGMGREATVFYRCLADLPATHWGQEYNQTINWLRCYCPLHCYFVPSCVSEEAGLQLTILCLGHWTYQWSLLRASSLISLFKSNL